MCKVAKIIRKMFLTKYLTCFVARRQDRWYKSMASPPHYRESAATGGHSSKRIFGQDRMQSNGDGAGTGQEDGSVRL